ncbi:hypothetical protein BLOT_015144 [Blomia tropicalis]|nr:hypothetical protein BLOT_015144 [Blomia tropicalis]
MKRIAHPKTECLRQKAYTDRRSLSAGDIRGGSLVIFRTDRTETIRTMFHQIMGKPNHHKTTIMVQVLNDIQITIHSHFD